MASSNSVPPAYSVPFSPVVVEHLRRLPEVGGAMDGEASERHHDLFSPRAARASRMARQTFSGVSGARRTRAPVAA